MTDASNAKAELLSTIHLSGRGCSRRAVQYRILTPPMVSHIESQVSHSLDSKATQYDFSEAVVMMALEQMIVAVSDPDITPARYRGIPEEKGGPAPLPIAWTKPGTAALHDAWESYFNAKDTTILKRIYAMEHVVSQDELDEVMAGKVTTVAP